MRNTTLDRADMNDLEATRLCYIAMGDLPVVVEREGTLRFGYENCLGPPYNPLHQDVFAMALVKRFRLTVISLKDVLWEVRPQLREAEQIETVDADLNRAIVYCVAAMQQATTAKGDA